MMNIIKLTRITFFCLTFTVITSANAALVQFSVEGVITTASATNDYGLSNGDTIFASGVFDDSTIRASSIVEGGTLVDFTLASNNMTFNVGNNVYTDDMEFNGGAQLYFQDDLFDGFNYQASNGTFDAWGRLNQLDPSGAALEDFTGFSAPDNNWIGGYWTASSYQVTTVPIPAAVWLFGTGLIFLSGIGRKKQYKTG